MIKWANDKHTTPQQSEVIATGYTFYGGWVFLVSCSGKLMTVNASDAVILDESEVGDE